MRRTRFAFTGTMTTLAPGGSGTPSGQTPDCGPTHPRVNGQREQMANVQTPSPGSSWLQKGVPPGP